MRQASSVYKFCRDDTKDYNTAEVSTIEVTFDGVPYVIIAQRLFFLL